MAKPQSPSVYIPTDKNIFDALQHKKITHSSLLAFLRKRGLFCSNSADKQNLSSRISRLTFDYENYLDICKLLENPNKREKTTQSTIKTDATSVDITKACKTVVSDAVEAELSDSYKVVQEKGSTKLVVDYTEIDFTKTELNQKSRKTCEIEVTTENGEVKFRLPANKKAKEIASKIKDSLSIIKGEELVEEVISLESIASAEARSYFFEQLLQSIDGYEFDTVSSVDVYHDIDSLSDDDSDEPNHYAGYINKAVLAGSGVLESAEFNQLHKRGFFIYKLVWTAIDKTDDGDKVEFEALFGEPASCSDFKYLVRGVYNFKDSTKEHNVTRRVATPKEVRELNKLLEKAAKSAYDKVIEKYQNAKN